MSHDAPTPAPAPRPVSRARRAGLATAVLAALSGAVLTVAAAQRAPADPAEGLAQTLAQGVAADALPAGSHLGFDTSVYPGDDAMQAWKDAGRYEWVGYYLPAPCHKDDTWSGKRAQLSSAGWGVAVIYVGQQTWGKTPGKATLTTRWVTKTERRAVVRNGRRTYRTVTRKVPVRVTEEPRALPGQSCSAGLVSSTQGTLDAEDAVARAEREGFAHGTVVFLDVERMERVPQAMRDYYAAWTARVLADGRYRPGIYAHTHNAELVYGDVKAVFASAGAPGEVPFWVAGGKDFSPEKLPSEVGHAFAAMWQGMLDVTQTHGGVRLPIDVNVAAVPSPSEQLTVALAPLLGEAAARAGD